MTNIKNNEPINENKEIIEERKRRIFSKKTFLLLVISLSIAAYLLLQLELTKTIAIFKQSDIRLFVLACLIYLSSNFFKSLRFYSILNSYSISLFRFFIIASYHNFFNQILPARTGELTFVYYAKKIGKLDISKGFHALLIVRIFDFIIISIFFITSLLLFYGQEASELLLGLGIFFFIISIILLFNLKRVVLLFGSIFHKIIIKTGIQDKSLIIKISEKLDLLIEEFNSFKTGKFIISLAITSILVWGALYLLFYTTLLVFGVSMPFLKSVIGSTGGVLTNVLPINSFGSFGTLEAGWTGGFIFVGLPAQMAIITGFGYHIISFLSSAIIALISFIIQKLFIKD